MPVDRPTFSESWYRVADLRPRLRGTVQIHRQYFRGQMWHVIQDPSNNQFFRLNRPAYFLVALLDGQRSVSDVWRICNEELGDDAPTQNETVQLLGQLYASNLLQGDMPPDAEGLFGRYRKRIRREVQGYLTNLLFVRIPLLDPDRFLESWVGLVGRLFSPIGAILWIALILAGSYTVITNWELVTNQAESIFSQQNIMKNALWLGLTYLCIKVIHELGHAFACKTFGKREQGGGEVHVLGVMFLVFMPLPYVDASSAWALRSKWHRAIVGAGGMIVELSIASVAAMVWAATAHSFSATGQAMHGIAYNVMFIGSISTLVFNGNPLLRYDGYYILSDLLEIPNLSQRSTDFLKYLVKRYVWSVRQARNPAHSRGEIGWFAGYGVASTIYRTIVVVSILMFVASKLFILGAILALAAAIAWLAVPLGKFVHYLGTSGELSRTRGRAVLTVLGAAAVVIGVIGLVPFPDHIRGEGLVEPIDYRVLYSTTEGRVLSALPTDAAVGPTDVLVAGENPKLVAQLRQLKADLVSCTVDRSIAQATGQNTVPTWDAVIRNVKRQIDTLGARIDELNVRPPISGQWISPYYDRLVGRMIPPGQALGIVASPELMVRVQVPHDLAVRVIAECLSNDPNRQVEMRFKGRPDLQMPGRIRDITPAGRELLASPALSVKAGGMIVTDPKDSRGTRAADKLFDVLIDPAKEAGGPSLRPFQVVEVRFELPKKPLAQQWWRSLLQLIDAKFNLSA